MKLGKGLKILSNNILRRTGFKNEIEIFVITYKFNYIFYIIYKNPKEAKNV